MKIGEFLIGIVAEVTGDDKVKKVDDALAKLTKTGEKFAKGQIKIGDIVKGVTKGFQGGKLAVGAFATALVGAMVVVDKIGYKLAQTQQKFISFQRQTGISLDTLNKYASASASVNLGATPEAMAGSLQRVAQNLFDIRMGRGDISPYQELGFFGGTAINPYGKSVEQIIEELRHALKGVSDIQATNIITRMGFSPEDLIMLRMSREEFEKIQSIYLSPEKQEALNRFGLQMRSIKETFRLWGQEILVYLFPIATSFMTMFKNTIEPFVKWIGSIFDTKIGRGAVFAGLLAGFDLLLFRIHPVLGAINLLIQAIDFLNTMGINIPEKIADFWETHKKYSSPTDILPFLMSPFAGISQSRDRLFEKANITINTSQPPSVVIDDINRKYGVMAGQLAPRYI